MKKNGLKLSPANEEEKEMLGLLPDTKKNSELGCQIKINKNLDGDYYKLYHNIL